MVKNQWLFSKQHIFWLLISLIVCSGSPAKSHPVLPDNQVNEDAFGLGIPMIQGFNVKEYGAVGDGITLETLSINRAIEAAVKAGGGTVYFPSGKYLSGSIHLKSHIRLYLDRGAVIIASGNREDFDKPEENPFDKYQDFGHSHWQNSLIWGIGLIDIGIEGPGQIYGKGLTRETPLGKLEGLGNKSIALKNCKGVLLKDFSIFHGGHFGILATGIDNMTIDNLLIDTNRDGIDIDACKNVVVSNCIVNAPTDDAICPKSSYALGYNRPTENLVITNCIVSGFLEGSVLDGTYKKVRPGDHVPQGRIKLGTESNGGFKNITISNCVFDYCRGLALETVDGGDLEDVSITNITMRNILDAPIFIRLGSRQRAPEGTAVAHLRRININGIVVSNAGSDVGCIINGIPNHYVEDINISNIKILYAGGGTKKDASIQPLEKENAYPEPDMFGKLPAYGFFIRHVKGLTLENIQFSYGAAEGRPPFVFEDVHNSDLRFIRAATQDVKNLILLRDVSEMNLFRVGPYKEMEIKDTRESIF